MKRVFLTLLVVVVLAAAAYLLLQDRSPSEPADTPAPNSENYLPETAPVGATLLDGLGDYSRPITSSHPEVQQWFDQALMLTYGFNHQAAERSFLKAVELDPECAMCWWGAALVLGPHVNAGMDPAQNAAAWERLQTARTVSANAEPWEQAYIEALGARYAETPPDDRKPLDEAYAGAMKTLVAQYPDDLDAATLYAESLMNLQPWDYWDAEGNPTGSTAEVVSVLESVMQRNGDHAGALHLYIHAVEASNEPERGVAAADHLRDLIPGSGHLVHMPAHIYARVGRWHDSVIANQRAIEADNAYLAACRPLPGVYALGYVPHNHHFLWFAATMGGDSATALAAADATHERTSDPELMRTPGFETMQYFAATPIFAKVRFGHWDELAAMPRPEEDLLYLVAAWEYAQSLAAIRQGRMDEARQHHAALVSMIENPTLQAMTAWGRYSLIHGLNIAELILAAELAWSDEKLEETVAVLQEAIAIEDELPYDEPPAWHAAVRQTLGAVLLEAGQAVEAEEAYRAELRRNPENGWSLYGLEQALRAQGRVVDADEVAQRFNQTWEHADIELSSSRL